MTKQVCTDTRCSACRAAGNVLFEGYADPKGIGSTNSGTGVWRKPWQPGMVKVKVIRAG